MDLSDLVNERASDHSHPTKILIDFRPYDYGERRMPNMDDSVHIKKLLRKLR